MKIRMLKRFAAALTAASITSVSLAMSTICPVSAVGGFAWLEWAELESLLQGIGFTSGNESLTDATIDYLEMTYDQIYQLTDPTGGGTAKPIWEQSWWDDSIAYLDHLVTWNNNSYETVGSVGSYDSSDLSSYVTISDLGSTRLIFDGSAQFYNADQSKSVTFYDNLSCFDIFPYFRTYQNDNFLYFVVKSSSLQSISSAINVCGQYININYRHQSYFSVGDDYYLYGYATSSFALNGLVLLQSCGIPIPTYDCTPKDFVSTYVIDHSFTSGSSDFIGPVYSYPAAEQLAKDNNTSSGIRLDVKTADGVPDLQAALDGAGVDTVDDLVVGVADGSIPMQQVFADAKVTPYVLADTTTGAVVTDLGVAATGTAVKPVALTADLAVPSDLSAAATYAIEGKTWDPDMAKYKLPLFQYFPFCLPWDIYQVLSSFAADPVAPVITIPIGKFFANKKNIDGSAVKDYTVTVDLGEDKYSKWFSYLRLLESAGIIIGLVLISVKLIHGGR